MEDLLDVHVEEAVASTLAQESGACYTKAIQHVQDMEYFEGKRHKLESACAQWMNIISRNWDSCDLGVQLKADLQADPTGNSAMATLQSAFGVKSPATLIKRASTVRKFIRWCEQNIMDDCARDLGFLPFKEAHVWSYFQGLRAMRMNAEKGFTGPSNFLETVRFCKFTLGFFLTEGILESRRLLGFAAIEKREKGPARQAPPLQLEHLKQLHAVLASDSNPVDRLGAGVMLICLYSRARWSDLRAIHHVEIECKRNGCMVLFTREHKTCSVGERREQCLPLIVPWHGVTQDDWLGCFLTLYEQCGLDIHKVPLGPLLPAPKLETGFYARPLSTEEAARWLRMLLQGTSNADSFRSHSLKCTLLVWCAKAGFDREVRAVLGHHHSALTGSEVVYSRHLQTRAIRKLQMLLHKLRIGLGVDEEWHAEADLTQMAAGMTPRPVTKAAVAMPSTPAICNIRLIWLYIHDS